jgi:hypothetical protein
MQFKIPQFLERQPLILGPLAFKQSIYFGVAILVSFYLYSVAPFFIFLMFSVPLITLAFCLSFIKIEGIPFPEVIVQSFGFVFSPKVYLWEKKENLRPIKFKDQKQEEKKEKFLKVAPRSILKDLRSKIEGGY